MAEIFESSRTPNEAETDKKFMPAIIVCIIGMLTTEVVHPSRPVIFMNWDDPGVLGGPCVGKGTHCKKLAQELPVTHVSVGDLLRAVEEKNPNYNTVLERMEAGRLVSTEIVQETLEKFLFENLAKDKKHFLVDGFPRSVEQAQAFEDRVSI